MIQWWNVTLMKKLGGTYIELDMCDASKTMLHINEIKGWDFKIWVKEKNRIII